MESSLLKVEIKPSLLIFHKSIPPICPLSWLISSVLKSCLYSTYCTVYNVYCNVGTVFSLFVWQIWLAKPKQNLSVNDIFNSKFCRIKCNVYCIQCIVGTVFFVWLLRLSNPKLKLSFKNNNLDQITCIQNK